MLHNWLISWRIELASVVNVSWLDRIWEGEEALHRRTVSTFGERRVSSFVCGKEKFLAFFG